ncbi:hypothetical protein PMAYCL1PPCAC_27321 [Pristionchus mayeri]|uniref:Peptidase S1 domain-containing protein n=1 Tax=Pristionchus mayeri TaxID=1317129 RepID=A0AAN5D5B7_9BILA|nr:hypothetical protein PMAYCL1PPCAC_27320 [Pristionchus mayeri]GMR57126.1 hypothetical protein PMAYCL1PPCAC_27321 [Pristionchus mayeri]
MQAITCAVLIALIAASAASPTRLDSSVVAAAHAFAANQTGNSVIGGHTVDITKYPWTVSICHKSGGGCTFEAAGSIIGDRWILTSGGALGKDSTSYRVTVGSNNYDKNGDQSILAEEIYYGGFSYDEDIALIRLSGPIKFGSRAQAIRLPAIESDTDNTSAMFAGWGHTSDSWFASMSSTLNEAQMYIGDGGVCQSRYGSKWNGRSMLCVGGNGPTTCHWDVGGPLMKKRSDGYWYLYGLAGNNDYYATGCSYPTIFTRIDYFCSWIERITRADVSCQ